MTDAPGEEMAVAAAVVQETPAKAPMLPTTSSPPWPAQPGTCSSSSTPWAKRKWDATSSPVGLCIWRASSSSAPCGDRSQRVERRWRPDEIAGGDELVGASGLDNYCRVWKLRRWWTLAGYPYYIARNYLDYRDQHTCNLLMHCCCDHVPACSGRDACLFERVRRFRVKRIVDVRSAG